MCDFCSRCTDNIKILEKLAEDVPDKYKGLILWLVEALK